MPCRALDRKQVGDKLNHEIMFTDDEKVLLEHAFQVRESQTEEERANMRAEFERNWPALVAYIKEAEAQGRQSRSISGCSSSVVIVPLWDKATVVRCRFFPIHAEGKPQEQRFAASRVGTEELSANARIPKHKHLLQDEILLIQSGTAHVWLGNQESDVHAGGMVFIPSDTWISLKNTGTEACLVLQSRSHENLRCLKSNATFQK
jgi:quercetin dioxygenase-like cupin family protein